MGGGSILLTKSCVDVTNPKVSAQIQAMFECSDDGLTQNYNKTKTLYPLLLAPFTPLDKHHVIFKCFYEKKKKKEGMGEGEGQCVFLVTSKVSRIFEVAYNKVCSYCYPFSDRI